MPYRQLPDPPLRELDLKVGGRYNWINQPERLVYLGLCEPRNGRWHQFAKVDEPNVVWCEIHPSDLHRLEPTLPPPPPPETMEVLFEGKVETRLVDYVQTLDHSPLRRPAPASSFPRKMPKLADDERIEWVVGSLRPHIFRVK